MVEVSAVGIVTEGKVWVRIVGIVTKGNVCTNEVCERVEVFLLKESLSFSPQDSPLLFLHASVIPRCTI
jgi:hypothetical protein